MQGGDERVLQDLFVEKDIIHGNMVYIVTDSIMRMLPVTIYTILPYLEMCISMTFCHFDERKRFVCLLFMPLDDKVFPK